MNKILFLFLLLYFPNQPTLIAQKYSDNRDNIEQKNEEFASLKDTLKVAGNAIVVLRPDSLRFNSYIKSGKEWIYEVDSDFGVGINGALDSFQHSNIQELITTKRYISIENCRDCPTVIDRDTIDYGIIMSRQNKNIQIDQNIYGADYYLELFKKYFSY